MLFLNHCCHLKWYDFCFIWIDCHLWLLLLLLSLSIKVTMNRPLICRYASISYKPAHNSPEICDPSQMHGFETNLWYWFLSRSLCVCFFYCLFFYVKILFHICCLPCVLWMEYSFKGRLRRLSQISLCRYKSDVWQAEDINEMSTTSE